MIVRDLSPTPYEGGKMSFFERLHLMLKHGFSWPAEMKSQEVVIRHLLRSLDNSFTLLRNTPLPAPEVIVPLILIGPQGISAIYNSPAKGIVRTQGNSWSLMNSSSGKFQATKPNLITRTNLMALAVETFLREHGYSDIPIEGILVLTDPGTHVDAIRPNVRVVLSDGLERFATQLAGASPVMDRERRYKLIEIIVQRTTEIEPGPKPESRPRSSLTQNIDTGFDQAIKPLRHKARFSTRQWLILGAFALAEVIILVIFLLIIMLTA